MIVRRVSESSKNEFSMAVERKAVVEKLGYLEALKLVMLESDIEPVQIAKYLSNSLRSKIQAEAENQNLLKNTIKGCDIEKKFT